MAKILVILTIILVCSLLAQAPIVTLNLEPRDPITLFENKIGFNSATSPVLTGSWDFTAGIVRIPISVTLPLTCQVGEIRLVFGASIPGQRLYVCETINGWVNY